MWYNRRGNEKKITRLTLLPFCDFFFLQKISFYTILRSFRLCFSDVHAWCFFFPFFFLNILYFYIMNIEFFVVLCEGRVVDMSA